MNHPFSSSETLVLSSVPPEASPSHGDVQPGAGPCGFRKNGGRLNTPGIWRLTYGKIIKKMVMFEKNRRVAKRKLRFVQAKCDECNL